MFSNFSDRPHDASSAEQRQDRKRLGGYLVEAGLLTTAQVDVALNDQKMTGMRFGEILAARGWVKQQTIEYFMAKVVMPERETIQPQTAEPPKERLSRSATGQSGWTTGVRSTTNGRETVSQDKQTVIQRDPPVAKPLPSVASKDDDVSWVG